MNGRPYLAGKASSGLNRAIALLTIPVINERFADTLGIRGCHSYRLDDVATGMRRSLEGNNDDLIVELAEVRREGLERSAESLRRWVERL